MRAFCKLAFVSFVIYGATVTASVITDIFSIAFIPLTMCLGFVLLIAVSVYFVYDISKSDTDILVAGINGERIATEVLSTLPDGYTVFQDVVVTYDNKKSEIDNIVVYCLANYLRRNGVNTYIQGMVYFANKACLLNLTGNSDIFVYSSYDSDEERLCGRILSGDHNLGSGSINHICKLIGQL